MERRKYSREFKLEAVNLVKERGVAIVQAARDFDLNCRYVGSCETSFFMALFGWEDDLNESERTRYSAQVAHSQAC